MKLPSREYQRVLAKVPVLCVDGILTNDGGEFLLVRRKHEPLNGRWWVPGGRVWKGEALDAAFHRKMNEELGINVKILRPVGYFEYQNTRRARSGSSRIHTVAIVFWALPLSLDVRLDEHSSDWGFFPHLPKRLARFERFRERWDPVR